MNEFAINLNEFFKSLPQWNIEAFSGYKPKTTFWQDFSIADAAYMFGENPLAAVRKTYRTAFKEWKSDHVFLTELVMVLNHKIWYHYEAALNADKKGLPNRRDYHTALSHLYDELWRECYAWGCEHLSGEEAAYFYDTLD